MIMWWTLGGLTPKQIDTRFERMGSNRVSRRGAKRLHDVPPLLQDRFGRRKPDED